MIKKPIIVLAILSTLLILGIIFLWWPKYQHFSSLRNEVKEKRAELDNKNIYFSELKKLSVKLEEYSEVLSKTDDALPASPDIPDLLLFLQQKSSQSGLILESINVQSAFSLGQGTKMLKIPFSLSLSGTYPAFKNFLSTVEKSARLTKVSYISFASPSKEDTFSFNLTIEAYSYDPSAPETEEPVNDQAPGGFPVIE